MRRLPSSAVGSVLVAVTYSLNAWPRAHWPLTRRDGASVGPTIARRWRLGRAFSDGLGVTAVLGVAAAKGRLAEDARPLHWVPRWTSGVPPAEQANGGSGTLPAMSYGTIMIGKLKTPGTGQSLVDAAKKWEERKVDGFQGSYALLSDDGSLVVSCITFESKEKYMALADSPGQDEWWRSTMAPLLDGDPQWIDGMWAE